MPQTSEMINPLHAQGVASTSSLLAHGWTRYRIAKAVENGRLVRPRKGWVARPNADPELVLAARHGVLLSCITLTKRLGLWLHKDQGLHLAVRHPGAQTRPTGATLHWHAPLLPRHPDALTDSIENALNAIAHCQPFEEAVAIWDSALNKGLADHAKLKRLPLQGESLRVLERASQFADSGLESYLRQRLKWLRVSLKAQVWLHGHRVDFLLGERLVLQIDGSHHVGAQRTSDNQHDALLALHGYTVIRVGYTQVMSYWPEVQQQIMEAIAQGLHLNNTK